MGALFFSSAGRIGPRDFVRAVWPVYLLGTVSLFLLCGPVIARASIIPFAIVHGVLVWSWLALHIKRASDAGANVPTASGIGTLYALAIAFGLILVDGLFTPGAPEEADRAFRDHPVRNTVPLYVGTVLWEALNKPISAGLMFKILTFVPFVPALLTIGYSIWLARQPSAADAPPNPAA
jgi:uncharacterized membrane protein YhaH (DUF805 family)